MNHQRQAGVSLLEMLIALVMFSMIMAAVLNTMNGISSYVTQEETQNDFEMQGVLAVRQLTNDFGNSAWFYSVSTAGATIHQMSTIRDFPKVTKDTSSAVGERLDTIEFTKIRSSNTVDASPANEHYNSTNIQTSTLIALSDYVNAKPIPLLVMNTNYPAVPTDNDVFVSHVWESTVTNDFDQNSNFNRVRHYLLKVINYNATDKTGQLVRKYYNGTGSAIPDDGTTPWTPGEVTVVLNNVRSFTVDIYDPNDATKPLNENQVKITIIQAKKPKASSEATVQRKIEFIAAMRSITR